MTSETAPQSGKRRPLFLLGGVGIAAICLAAFGIADRAKSMQEVGAWTDAQATSTVHVVQPRPGPSQGHLSLPGTVSAFATGTLFARASGYITAWHKDIGARVRKGDVLAEISAPDLDQQLAEAKAQIVQLQAAVEQAQANADLGKANNDRTSRLVAQGWSSQALGDTDRYTLASRSAALAVAKANIVAQQAAVSRLEELARFEQIRAPFDGVVTARNVDIGDLVTAGGTTGKALFQVSDVHRMRTYVNVPQAFFGAMTPGLKATLTLPGRDDTFAAELVSTSGAVSEGSRTALVQLQSDNVDGKLWPGAFAEVDFKLPSDPGALRIPTTAIVFGKHGMRVAAVDANGIVSMREVQLGRNLGNEVEVRSGVSAEDRLVDNPQESTESGDKVVITDAKPSVSPLAEKSASAAGKAID